MSDSPIGIAVVGAGGWGRNHVRNFAQLRGADLRYVCDRSQEIAADTRAQYPDVQVTPDLEVVLADPAVQGVVVATDAPSHHAVALAALEAGKDVFVEKPLALNSAHARELCERADAGGRILMVGHLLLYHPVVRALRELITSGELGDVLYLVCRRLNLGVVRQDENAWWSLAPHDLSIARYLLDSDPVAVGCHGGTYLQTDKKIEDVVFGTVRFAEGRLAHVHVSWLDPHKVRSLTVVGSKKMAVFDDTSPDQKLTVYDKGAVPPPAAVSYSDGVRVRTGEIRVPAIRMSEPLRTECEAFLEAIRTRKPPLADGRSGLAVVQALEAGARSLKTGNEETV